MLLREIWDIFFELFIFRLFARARSASANKRKIKSEKNISHISRKKHALIGLSHDTNFVVFLFLEFCLKKSTLIFVEQQQNNNIYFLLMQSDSNIFKK